MLNKAKEKGPMSRRGQSGVNIICDTRPMGCKGEAMPPMPMMGPVTPTPSAASASVDSQYVGNFVGTCCDGVNSSSQCVSAPMNPAATAGGCGAKSSCCQQSVDANVGAPNHGELLAMFMQQQLMQQQQQQAKIEVKPPKAIEDMKLVLMRRDVLWQWRFTMKDLMMKQMQYGSVDQKLVASLGAQALEQLSDYKSIPCNIILNKVSLLETSNDSFVEFGVDADWIADKSFVTCGGQKFTGYVPDEVRVFHPKDRVLYSATEEDNNESFRLLPLIGMTREELTKGVGVMTNGNVTVQAGTYLYNLLCSLGSVKKSASEAGIVIAKPSFDECILKIIGDMDRANSHVTKTANLNMRLCVIKPANPTKQEMSAAEMLNALVGVHAADEQAKAYYLDKMNKINVVLRLEYFVPQ